MKIKKIKDERLISRINSCCVEQLGACWIDESLKIEGWGGNGWYLHEREYLYLIRESDLRLHIWATCPKYYLSDTEYSIVELHYASQRPTGCTLFSGTYDECLIFSEEYNKRHESVIIQGSLEENTKIDERGFLQWDS